MTDTTHHDMKNPTEVPAGGGEPKTEPFSAAELEGVRQALDVYEPDSIVARLVATIDRTHSDMSFLARQMLELHNRVDALVEAVAVTPDDSKERVAS